MTTLADMLKEATLVALGELQHHRKLVAESLANRDALVIQMSQEAGMKNTEIAKFIGTTEAGVRQILKRQRKGAANGN